MGTLTSHNFLRHLVSVRESPNETKMSYRQSGAALPLVSGLAADAEAQAGVGKGAGAAGQQGQEVGALVGGCGGSVPRHRAVS